LRTSDKFVFKMCNIGINSTVLAHRLRSVHLLDTGVEICCPLLLILKLLITQERCDYYDFTQFYGSPDRVASRAAEQILIRSVKICIYYSILVSSFQVA
jgi:hypothetical protein